MITTKIYKNRTLGTCYAILIILVEIGFGTLWRALHRGRVADVPRRALDVERVADVGEQDAEEEARNSNLPSFTIVKLTFF